MRKKTRFSGGKETKMIEFVKKYKTSIFLSVLFRGGKLCSVLMGYFRHSFLEFIRHYFCLLPFCQNRDKTMDFIYFSFLLLFFDLCSGRCFFFFYVQPADRSGICYCGSRFLLYAKVSGKEELENSAHCSGTFAL